MEYTFELIMDGLLVNILGFLGILANILIIIVLRHCKIKSSISLIIKGIFVSINFTAGGHSTTMWTKVYTLLTTYSYQVDNYGHFTYYLPFLCVTKLGLFSDHLPTLSCSCSYGMTPSHVKYKPEYS